MQILFDVLKIGFACGLFLVVLGLVIVRIGSFIRSILR